MKVTASVFALVASAAFLAVRGNNASPIIKALELLSDMQSKIIGQGEAAQAAYAVFSRICEDRSKELAFEIKTAKREVAELQATVTQQTSIAASLDTRVGELVSTIATDDADLKAAAAIRAKEAADFGAQEKELIELVDTLERAISILEKGGASMMQLENAGSITSALNLLVEASTLSLADASQLAALLQSSHQSEDADVGAPDAAVYKGHSEGIIDTLGDLLEKAEGQLAEARNKETASLHSFEVLQLSLKDKIKFETKELDDAKKGISACNQKVATANGDLEITAKDLKEDTAALEDLHRDCMTKAQDYEAETQSRGEELKAIAAAKKIVAESTSGAGELSYGLSEFSLLQRSDTASFRAVHFVRDLARRQRSSALAQLAAQMAIAIRAGDDPFAKVKGLIANMIERLEADTNSEATEKAFCDKELSETQTKKDQKTTEIKKLSTKIDQMTSRSAQLKAEVAELENAISSLLKTQAEMDKLRAEEKAAYAKAKEEMENGIAGVQLALKVLRDYYAKEKAHAADEGSASGIIGLLEVVEADFSKGLIEMTSNEDAAQSAYEQETKENEVDKATKEQDVKYKSEESSGLDASVAEATSDRSGVQEELDAVLEYLRGLEQRCVAQAGTYEERKARMEAELAGLKEALEILGGETVFVQENSKRALRGVRVHQWQRS